MAAFNLGTLVGAGAADESVVRAALFEAAASCGLVRDDGQHSVLGTIGSGIGAGIDLPRDLTKTTVLSGASHCNRLAEGGRASNTPDRELWTLTQDDVASTFARRFAGALRYCHHTGSWFRWAETHWSRDETALAFQFVRRLVHELSVGCDPKELKEARKVSFAAGVERFAQGDTSLAVTINHWDGDPFLLGTPAGTVDLRTGTLRPPDPAHGITKLVAVGPSTRAECPLWMLFLHETTSGDEGLIRFLQQWCGYSLTGITREHALVFVYGPGGNGKSVFLNVVTGLLADYAQTAAMDTFTASKGDRHPTDLAMLRGARLVTASETEEGRAWAESRIKQMTGGDPVTARFMRQDFFTYQPQFKLMIVGNHKPVLQNVDDAARRRFNLVPFTRKPERPDRELEGKLKAEWPGILRWMIDGCLDWLQNGLVRPAAVQAATAAYFDEQDPVRLLNTHSREIRKGVSPDAIRP
jgi:putative DNA primase/helicase